MTIRILRSSKKNQYKSYELLRTYEKNRKKKLEKHLKKHPNDLLAKTCLDKNDYSYRRRRPIYKIWNPVSIYFASLLKMAGLNGNVALNNKKKFSSIGKN